jgi:hypothetical protein
MIKQACMTALALALVAGSAQAGGLAGGIGGGDDMNGVQLNGIPASGFAVETVELPDGAVVVQRSGFGYGSSGGSDGF